MMKVDVPFLCFSIPLTRIFVKFFPLISVPMPAFTPNLSVVALFIKVWIQMKWRCRSPGEFERGSFFLFCFFSANFQTPLVMTQGYTPSPFFRLVIHPGNVTNFVRVSRKHTLKQAGTVLFVVFYNRPNCARTKGTIVLLLICWNLSSEVECFTISSGW